MKHILRGGGVSWDLALIADRPPMHERRTNGVLAKQLLSLADDWDIPLSSESSLWSSAAGLVAEPVPVVCGVPSTRSLHRRWQWCVSAGLAELLVDCFQQRFPGEVTLNQPFSGGYITRHHGTEMPWI